MPQKNVYIVVGHEGENTSGSFELGMTCVYHAPPSDFTLHMISTADPVHEYGIRLKFLCAYADLPPLGSPKHKELIERVERIKRGDPE